MQASEEDRISDDEFLGHMLVPKPYGWAGFDINLTRFESGDICR